MFLFSENRKFEDWFLIRVKDSLGSHGTNVTLDDIDVINPQDNDDPLTPQYNTTAHITVKGFSGVCKVTYSRIVLDRHSAYGCKMILPNSFGAGYTKAEIARRWLVHSGYDMVDLDMAADLVGRENANDIVHFRLGEDEWFRLQYGDYSWKFMPDVSVIVIKETAGTDLNEITDGQIEPFFVDDPDKSLVNLLSTFNNTYTGSEDYEEPFDLSKGKGIWELCTYAQDYTEVTVPLKSGTWDEAGLIKLHDTLSMYGLDIGPITRVDSYKETHVGVPGESFSYLPPNERFMRYFSSATKNSNPAQVITLDKDTNEPIHHTSIMSMFNCEGANASLKYDDFFSSHKDAFYHN